MTVPRQYYAQIATKAKEVKWPLVTFTLSLSWKFMNFPLHNNNMENFIIFYAPLISEANYLSNTPFEWPSTLPQFKLTQNSRPSVSSSGNFDTYSDFFHSCSHDRFYVLLWRRNDFLSLKDSSAFLNIWNCLKVIEGNSGALLSNYNPNLNKNYKIIYPKCP